MAWFPSTETAAADTRLIADHAIWTGVVAGTLGLALLLRRRRGLAVAIAVAGFACSALDHITNNSISYLGRRANDDALVSVVKAVTGNGYNTVYLFVALAIVAILADLFILRRSWPASLPRPAAGLGEAWNRVLVGRALAFAHWQYNQIAGHSPEKMPAELVQFETRQAAVFAPAARGGLVSPGATEARP
jgi:hypothetical protein